jgi:hypothetical protein
MKVTAFQSQDGVLHTDELACVKRDFAIDIRGKIQTGAPALRTEMLSIKEICDAVVRNRDEIQEVITKYNRKIRGIESRKATS